MINLIFIFSLGCNDCVESLYANQSFMYFCIKSSIETQGEVGWLQKCFNPTPTPVVYSSNRSKAVAPVLVLLCCFVVNSTRRFVLSLALFYYVLVFLVLLALRLPRLGKRELIVLFVRLLDLRLFGFVCFLFLLVSGKDCSL